VVGPWEKRNKAKRKRIKETKGARGKERIIFREREGLDRSERADRGERGLYLNKKVGPTEKFEKSGKVTVSMAGESFQCGKGGEIRQIKKSRKNRSWGLTSSRFAKWRATR